MFAEIIETMTQATFPAGGVPEPEPEQTEAPDVPAYFRLEQRIAEITKADGTELREQEKELQGRLEAELEVIKRFEDYDLIAESKKPDFDRSTATTLQSESLVAQAVATSIKDELAAVRTRLRKLDAEKARKLSRLRDFADRLDVIRRSTAVAYVRGRGSLQAMDADHVRRWLSDITHVEAQLYALFPDEDDWPTVAELFESLTRYEVEPSTTSILFGNLHNNFKGDFEKFAPANNDGEKENG